MYLYIYMFVCAYVRTCVYIFVCVCLYMCMCLRTRAFPFNGLLNHSHEFKI